MWVRYGTLNSNQCEECGCVMELQTVMWVRYGTLNSNQCEECGCVMEL